MQRSRARCRSPHPRCGAPSRLGRRIGCDVPMTFGPHLFLAVLEGLVMAAVLALTALGLSLVFGVMRIVNVAHGEFFMLGAVLAWVFASLVPAHPALGFLHRDRLQPADRRRGRARRRAAGAEAAELRSGSDDRRHDRPALHHPAAGADLLRPGRAAGAAADQLPHPVPVVRLFRLQARRRRRLDRCCSSRPGSC